MGPSPFVGRDGELDRLAGELDASARRGSRIVIVVGEPGVGKTRLLSEFEGAARRRAQAGAAWIRARALEQLATVLEGPERISVLSESARLYAAFPAPAHEGRVMAALRTMGPAGRRAAQAVGELTIRESEVVRLAKRGLNTREIAGTLHVSERTVETHLAHIYRKLGVSGRKALLALDQPGEPGLVGSRSPSSSPPG